MTHPELFAMQVAQVNEALSACLTESCPQQELLEAMRYSLLSGGKRVRAILVLQFCEACGGRGEDAMSAACALEMLHAYSLIHDDLPCMDNDDLRRGKPTCHKVYGECLAMLAGDALQSAAFRTLLSGVGDRSVLAECALTLAEAAGERGMCGGQYLDTAATAHARNMEELTLLHALKTGALLRASCRIGALLGGGTAEQLHFAGEYAENIGMAFQIRDDVLDATSTAEVLGKDIGSDEANGKVTFLTLRGVEGCEELIGGYTDAAVRAAEKGFPNAPFLTWFARMLAGRIK